ncbi:MAG: preprotein translocase subunit SecG [Lewinellaceae bacterium]|nr:preprotein translocase subunit SecG [Saprospiraceae bacterium]MCB9341513.1 preprotein translocase subunit SecG [Lewinellaceae bacterium]
MILITILIAAIAFFLIAAVLIQNPKGGGVDSTFGGAQANQMFGAARSADLIEKITWGLAIALFLLCILATFIVGSGGEVGPTLQSQ